ncbi:uncharacterized protein LOC144368624 [Ictidomys tridecemlineatus]
MGRDLLTKLRARITLNPDGPQVKFLNPSVKTMSVDDEHQLFTPSKTDQMGKLPQKWIIDYPDAWAETAGLVKKPGGDYHPVQDLREVNNRVQDIHPTVPNPYNLLSTLNPELKWYTVLDLKDAFYCLPLHKDSQLLFAFEWVDPETGTSGQLTWTRLLQGFKNSPTLFDEALHRDLNNFRTTHPEVTLLQYVDDLLPAADTKENWEQQSGGLTASEYPGNLSPQETDTKLLDSTGHSLQFQKALHYVKDVHQLTHLGSKKLQAFLKDQEQKFPLTDTQRKKIAERVIRACWVCQFVNAYPSKLPTGKRL